ncbi:hypothetical protein ACWEQ8_35305, partial [Streptomyces noursei]
MENIEAIAALQDPVRRRLYEYVAAQGREVGRNEDARSDQHQVTGASEGHRIGDRRGIAGDADRHL